jgi:uncharacterized protein
MKINDRVYGEITIKEKVIQDLINSAPMQRLKKINQGGADNYLEPRRDVTRFEHSVGVWYLSSRYNRPIPEQIASLLHDIPHTAFSHVMDIVLKDENHEFHDQFYEKIIRESEIPRILKENGVDLEAVIDIERYPLLENKLPDISVDRWDYFVRQGTASQFMPKLLVAEFFDKVKVRDEKFYFTDINTASAFAILFMNFSRLIWLDPTSHGSFYLLASALRIALDNEVVTMDDLFTDDASVWAKMQKSGDTEIKKALARLTPKTRFEYAPESEAEFFGPNKPRFVDPLVEVDGELVRLTSQVDDTLKYAFDEFSKNYKYLGVREKR